MTIKLTDIKETKKGRMALFFDGEFIFSVLPELVFEYGLKIGETYETEYIAELQKSCELKDAKQKGYSYLSYRGYTKKGLEQKLEKAFGTEAAEAAAEEIAEMGYLNDEDYGIRLANDLYRLKLRSVRHIKMELIKRGIDKEQAAEIVENGEYDDRETLFQLIDKKYLSKLAAEGGKAKVGAALGRKGFSWDDIKSVLKEYEDGI